MSKGPGIHRTGGVGDAGVIIWDLADLSIPTAFVRVTAVHLNVSSAIAKDTLGELGAPLCRMPYMHTPSTVGVLVVRTVFPPIGEIIDACIKHGVGDIGGERGIVEDAWLESLVCIGMGQCMEGVVLFPLCVQIEFFKFCQIFGKVCHSVMGVTEALDFSS